MRESFVLHAEYIEDLPEEFKMVFLSYIYNYGIHGTEPAVTGLELTIWKKIQRRIDQDTEAWEEQKSKRAEAGKKHSGNQYTRRQKMEQMEQMEQMEHCSKCSTEMEHDGTNGTVSVSVSDNVSVSDSVVVSVPDVPPKPADKKNNKKFTKPTLAEISDYIAQQKYSFSAERFWNYYEANGWMVGRNHMKDWKAACWKWGHDNYSPGEIQRDGNVDEFKQFFCGAG